MSGCLSDPLGARDKLTVGSREHVCYRLDALEMAGLVQLARLPFSIRVVFEAERIHRSNLVGMGVLPPRFRGES